MQGRSWPFLHPIRDNGPDLSVWMPGTTITTPNATALRLCLLRSARSVLRIAESLEYFSFKNEVIRWVNGHLANTNAATDEVTIAVFLFLMS
jgi:hypothetical protein